MFPAPKIVLAQDNNKTWLASWELTKITKHRKHDSSHLFIEIILEKPGLSGFFLFMSQFYFPIKKIQIYKNTTPFLKFFKTF